MLQLNYQEAQKYMQQVGMRGSIFGLDPIQNLLNRLENPQNQLQVIHVAGTNGKGSVCSFLEDMYRAEQKRVGRYISPTLHGYLERFQIDGMWMEEEDFARYLTDIKPLLEEMEQEGLAIPTAFELETVISFLFFVEKKVDIVLLETGMGGREDATNVVKLPLCTVFSEIGRDHMQFLGDTVEQITREKAGIMRDGCPVIAYPNIPEVNDVLFEQAKIHSSKFVQLQIEDVTILSESLEGSRFIYDGEEYEISLVGTHQIYNAVTAIACKKQVDGLIHKDALKQVKWEGRFEIIQKNPLWIKDGAHNMDGVKALSNSLEKHFTNEKIIFIIGVLRDKEYKDMMRLLCPKADRIYTITPPTPRGLEADALADVIKQYCNQVQSCDSLEQAVRLAKKQCSLYQQNRQEAVVVAWGSLSYIGQIEKYMDSLGDIHG